MGGQEQVRKVAVAMTVMVDYDKFYDYLREQNPKLAKANGCWSAALELGRIVSEIPGIHDVVSVTNLTMQNTGKDFEEDPIPGAATDV